MIGGSLHFSFLSIQNIICPQSPSSVGLSAFELLARWYDERKPKAFLSSEGKGLKMEGVSEVLADMSSVVRPMNIKGLPYMLLNGHEIDRSVFWAKIELEK